MLTLMLLRHAKAEAQARGHDAARALAPKGETDAIALGRHLAGVGLLPDLALVSAAERTRATFELLCRGAGREVPARIEDKLYNATDLYLRDTLRLVDDRVSTLMIVGHNPAIMDVALLLATEGDPMELSRLGSRFPPCALAVLAFGADTWRDARASGGRLDLLLMPEDIPSAG